MNQNPELDAHPLLLIDEMMNAVARLKVYSQLDLRSAHHQARMKGENPHIAFEAGGRFHELTVYPSVR